jgi:hypothetical protein
MRCRECAAEVAATARVCSRCGAPIVGQQPPVVADTVAGAVSDNAVSDPAVSDAAGKAVAAGVAGQAPPGPYVPGSGEWVPAKLRLVLAGYAGLACGLSAGALASAAAVAFLFFFVDDLFFVDDVDLDDLTNVLLCSLAAGACIGGAGRGGRGAQGPHPVFQAASAAQRSTHGHGDGLEAWRTHADTRHSAGRHRPRVLVAVRSSPRVAAEGRHASAR